jgi:hypothetical protein
VALTSLSIPPNSPAEDFCEVRRDCTINYTSTTERQEQPTYCANGSRKLIRNFFILPNSPGAATAIISKILRLVYEAKRGKMIRTEPSSGNTLFN